MCVEKHSWLSTKGTSSNYPSIEKIIIIK